MYDESPLTHGAALWQSYDARAAVIPADGCVDLILRGDAVDVAGGAPADPDDDDPRG
ncbi:hypothetical protein ACFJIY_12290 [Pimelobacter simplex]|uniref:hypothetical protein n=1 Tax=Nocardioides simplex TaxID=2045 RepID=UPI003671BD48